MLLGQVDAARSQQRDRMPDTPGQGATGLSEWQRSLLHDFFLDLLARRRLGASVTDSMGVTT